MQTIASMCRGALAVSALCTAWAASAAVSVNSVAFNYNQSFDSLSSQVSDTALSWANDSTLPGWSLFKADGSPLSSYVASDGSSSVGSFHGYGGNGQSDRALGGQSVDNGAYFGPVSVGATAGWIAVAFSNDTGSALSGFHLAFDGEQWKKGSGASSLNRADTMVLQYGLGSSFGSVSSWVTPGGNFDWTSPVLGTTSGTSAVDGNVAGKVAGRGGDVSLNWAAGQTLWIRWVEKNDTNVDHALAIDNLNFSVSAVPEPESGVLWIAGLAAVAAISRRRVRA